MRISALLIIGLLFTSINTIYSSRSDHGFKGELSSIDANFKVLSAPIVVTNAATMVAGFSATLNGSGIPNGEPTTGWFRYSTTNPGTANDVAGTRVPAVGGTDLGTGNTSLPFSQTINGLTVGVTYYFWAIASNGSGTSFGSVLNFTITGPPVAETNTATFVSATTATLNGTGTPNGANTTGWFRYSTTNPGTGNDVSGIRAPVSGGTFLGSGAMPTSYTQPLSGLTPATTYYFWSIVSSTEGSSFGAVMFFTTLSAVPTVTTNAATIAGTSVTLNGNGNPNGDPATGWFRYSTVNPGSPNDGSGIRVPASGGTSLGAGNSGVPYSQGVSGLVLGTTYYCWAIASNGLGTTFGSIVTFTPASPPIAVTNAATGVFSTSATLNGSGNPNGAVSTGYFRYSTTNPGTGNDIAGTRAPASGGAALGSGVSPVPYTQLISGFTPVTTYYYWAVVTNSQGISFGAVTSFTTSAGVPTVVTNTATSLVGMTATLNGTVNPNGDAATGWFRYSTVSPGTGNDTNGTRAPASGGTSLGSGIMPVPYSQPITGLSPLTTYFFWSIASNSIGTSFGNVNSFIIPTAPTATTNPATIVGGNSATLNGSGNPNASASTAWFRYSTTNPGTGDDVAGTRVPVSGGTSLGSGLSPVAHTQAITGLIPGTTYYYWNVVSSVEGVAFGNILSFITLSIPPTVTTSPTTLITGTSATLNGTANPNNNAATGWFRYSTVSPGTPNDSFGTRAPSSGGSSLGSGNSAVPYSQPITGLLPSTTYYYCAIASNSSGTSFGSLQTFTTASAPIAITNAATLVTASTATLNGSGDPNFDATTGWFRYSTVNPGTANDLFGIRVPSSGGTSLGSGTSPVLYAEALTGLAEATTYYYAAIVQNSLGISYGTIQSFVTPSAPFSNNNVGIGTTSPNDAAMLDVSSTSKGFLPPRLSTSQRNAMTAPVQGLVIYCTDCGGGELQVYNSFGWTNMLGNAPSGPLAIGDSYAGGKIAYILQPGDPGYVYGQTHGLIAAATDQSSGATWGCSGTLISGADGIVLGTGNQNTIDIMAGCATAGIAARVCGDLVLNGYSDWYLPSQDELNKLYLNKSAIGGFGTGTYWTSLEFDSNKAWIQSFGSGGQSNTNKTSTGFVRGVRGF